MFLQSLLDPEGEDEYFTRIGSGGLLNMNKLRKVQAILEKIVVVHQHHAKRLQKAAFLNTDRLRWVKLRVWLQWPRRLGGRRGTLIL